MKKDLGKRLLAIGLSAVMLLGTVPFVGAEEDKECEATNNDLIDIEIGDCITLGTYNNQSIKWRCVDIDENGPLMLSEEILCNKEFDAAGESDKYHSDGWGWVREAEGSNCWSDSNIRQWLNTSGTVSYTHCPPSYAKEKGFMTGFTASELALVKSVTQKTYVNDWETTREGYVDGGSREIEDVWNMEQLDRDYSNYMYQLVTDRFFLLNQEQICHILKNSNEDHLSQDSRYYTRAACTTGASFQNVQVLGKGRAIGGVRASDPSVGIRPAFYLNKNFDVNFDNFDEYTYRTNILLNPETLSYKIFHANLTQRTPSYIYATEMTDNPVLVESIEAWDGLTNQFFDLIDDPSNAYDLIVRKRDIYLALLLSALQVTTQDIWPGKLESTITESGKNIQQITSVMKNLYSIDITDKKVFQKLTKEQKQSLKSEMSEYTGLKEFDKLFDKYFSIAEDINTFFEQCIYAQRLLELSEATKSVVQEMLQKCPSENGELKQALEICTNIFNSQYTDIVSGITVITLGKEGAEKLIEQYWSLAKKSAYSACPQLMILMSAYSLSKTATNIVFKTDDLTESYYKMLASVELEEVLVDALESLQGRYQQNSTAENAKVYLSAVDLCYQMWDVDCQQAFDMVDTLDESLVNKLLILLNAGWNQYDDPKNAIASIRQDYQMCVLDLTSNWIYQLEEDYPNTGLHEYYYFLIVKQSEKTETIKKYTIACPVNVFVYDAGNCLVASVDNGRIWSSNDVTIQLDGDEKTIYFYEGANYKVKIVGYDVGTMNLTIDEFEKEEKTIRSVYYKNVPVSNGITYTTQVDERQMDNAQYSLNCNDSNEVPISLDTLNPNGEIEHTLHVNNGIMLINGIPCLETQLYANEIIEIFAVIPGNRLFDGWKCEMASSSIENPTMLTTQLVMPDFDIEVSALMKAPPADYTSLDELIDRTDAMLASDEIDNYTKDSVAVLESALKQAKAVDRNLTSEQQTVIDAAAHQLQTALDGLVRYTKLDSVTIVPTNPADEKSGELIYHETPWYKTWTSQTVGLGVQVNEGAEIKSVRWQAANWSVDDPEAVFEGVTDRQTVTVRPTFGIGPRSFWVQAVVEDYNDNIIVSAPVKVRFYNWDWQK